VSENGNSVHVPCLLCAIGREGVSVLVLEISVRSFSKSDKARSI